MSGPDAAAQEELRRAVLGESLAVAGFDLTGGIMLCGAMSTGARPRLVLLAATLGTAAFVVIVRRMRAVAVLGPDFSCRLLWESWYFSLRDCCPGLAMMN
ncbi:MAG: hypothetical protein LC130_28975 [Bryobacterales bacterium]|nr:hypothetical protein [Bryobacterales bacterium]MEB2361275.1 hypothetical protein [Bryobacterales bacterium]